MRASTDKKYSTFLFIFGLTLKLLGFFKLALRKLSSYLYIRATNISCAVLEIRKRKC